jgi:hypothetical protein
LSDDLRQLHHIGKSGGRLVAIATRPEASSSHPELDPDDERLAALPPASVMFAGLRRSKARAAFPVAVEVVLASFRI